MHKKHYQRVMNDLIFLHFFFFFENISFRPIFLYLYFYINVSSSCRCIVKWPT